MRLNDRLKEGLKIGISLAASGAAIYGAEKYGVSDWIMDNDFWKASLFGDWAKYALECASPIVRTVSDVGVGSLGGLLTYSLLHKKN